MFWTCRWFALSFTPDPGQRLFGGALAPPAGDNPDAPPDVFAAFQQQLGLRLQPTKAPVEVMVFDHVVQPSANQRVLFRRHGRVLMTI
jgi:uncharacterized protein (TIGR03435 family)